MSHPTPPELQAFASGRLSIQETERIASHLAACDSCCQQLGDTQDDRLLALARSVRTDSLAETVIAQSSKDSDHANTKKPLPGTHSRQNLVSPSVADPGDADIPAELKQHPRYEVLGVLGKGGMGVVYWARHRIMERQVALKVISSRFMSNQIAVERFQQEVRSAAKLSHPNIVTAYDAEQAGLLHFLVMEYIEGQSLAQRVAEQGPMPVNMAVDLIQQACLGLQHAHERKMIHRDIKPQNLIVTPSGQLKLLDFGLARLLTSAEGVSQTAATAMNLTAVGMVLGTPDFMAPEQALDPTSVDARSDIFSLGCTLHFLLSATSPFAAGSFSEMLQGGLRRSASTLVALRSDVPPSLVRILEQMMAEDPEQRFQSAAQVAEALGGVATAERRHDSPPPKPAVSPEQASATTKTVLTQQKQPDQHAANSSQPRHSAAGTRRSHRRTGPWKVTATKASPSFLRRLSALLVRYRAISLTALAAVLATIVIPGLLPTTNVTSSPETTGVVNAVADPPNREVQQSLPAVKGDTSSQSAKPSQGQISARVPRILMLVPNKEFRWADRAAFDALDQQGIIELTTTSWSTTIQGNNPTERAMSADLLMKDVVPDDFDVILIHGGKYLVDLTTAGPLHEHAGRLIRQMHNDGKLITGISAGPGVLASFELLDGVAATGHPLIHEDVRMRFGVTLSTDPVVRSGQFITAKDNSSIPEFIRELQAALEASSGDASR